MRDDETRHHLPPGPFSLAFFGLAFARAWLSCVFFSSDMALPLPALSHAVFDVAYVACAAVVLACARRLVPLVQRPWALPASLAGMLAASAAFVAQPVLPESWAGPLGGAASALGGIAFIGFTLMNSEVLAGVSILRIALYLSGSNLLGSVLVFFLGGAGLVQTGAAVVALPVVAVALLHGARGAVPERDRQHAGYPRFQLPWKLLVLAAVFSFAYGLRQTTLAAGAGRHSTLSTALVAGTIFALAYFFPQRLEVAKLCRAPMPLMLCGIMLAPVESLLGQTVSSYLVAIGFTLMRFLVGLMFYDMAKRTGVAMLPLSAANGCTQLFSLLGTALSERAYASMGGAASTTVTTVVVCVMLVVSFALLFSERELTSRWGIKVLDQASLGEAGDEENRLAARCDALAEQYRLTPREDEILRELARGKAPALVAQNLMIAPGTLRAHARHIYEKMGIHSREELYDLLGLRWGVREQDEA